MSSKKTGKERTVYSTCLGCNARCGIRFHVRGEQILSVSGNPYHPYNMLGKPIPMQIPIEVANKMSASLCGKAHEIPHYVHNKYRVLTPLKRAGKRGEGKFEPISWEQLIKEIARGGKLFAHLGEDRHVEGLKDILSDEPINPDAPELGPKRNGFCFLTGRLQSGRKEFIDRFVKFAFGSINRIGHTDICGIGFRMGNFIFTEGAQVELKADPWSARFILVFGANMYEALQPGVNTYGATVANRHSKGQVKFCIVDPRAQRASSHAEKWIPIKPGTDGAFAMGLIRWIIDNEAYNRAYLEAPNLKAANRLGNGGYVNASHLVIWDEKHGYKNPLHGKFLRQSHLSGKPSSGGEDPFMVFTGSNKRLMPYDKVSKALIDVEAIVPIQDGRMVNVKTAFRLMKEAVLEYSLDDYADICGVDKDTLIEVAAEFAKHAPKSSVCQYHGAGNYLGGAYAAFAVAALNALTGSLETKGGYCSSCGPAGDWQDGRYGLCDFPGKRTPTGIKLSREGFAYEDTTEFKSKEANGEKLYPAKRPWFPFTKGGLSVEALAGIDEAYPYKCSALFLYFFNPVYSIPGGFRFKKTLESTEKVPLLVSIDIGVNESNVFADYIIPDVTYAEGQYGWLSPHAPCFQFTSVRTPAIHPLTAKTPDGRHISLETFLIDLAMALDLPGFGPKAISDLASRLHPLEKAEDFYLKAFANIAYNAGLEHADAKSLAFVEQNYPVAKYKNLISVDEWHKVARLLSRGGVFHSYGESFRGRIKRHAVKRFCIYNENLSDTICSITGERFKGTLALDKQKLSKDSLYPFTLISFKRALHTQSRTVWHPVALRLWPENFIYMNKEEAVSLGFSHMEEVMVSSPLNGGDIRGRLFLTDTVRPGVVAISISYGHKQLGASKVSIKGMPQYQEPDKSLGRGINPNDLAMLDRRFNNTPFIDGLGGIPDFSSSMVRIDKLDS